MLAHTLATSAAPFNFVVSRPCHFHLALLYHVTHILVRERFSNLDTAASGKANAKRNFRKENCEPPCNCVLVHMERKGMDENGWIDECKRKYKNDRMKLDVGWRKSENGGAERERVVVCVCVYACMLRKRAIIMRAVAFCI